MDARQGAAMIGRPVPPVAPKKEPACSISLFIGVKLAVPAAALPFD